MLGWFHNVGLRTGVAFRAATYWRPSGDCKGGRSFPGKRCHMRTTCRLPKLADPKSEPSVGLISDTNA